MARTVTADELVKLRSDGQKTDLFLTLDAPPAVYTALVNQATFTDPMIDVTYDGGSGTLTDVKVGMTLMVGSAAGGHDLGMIRIRKTPTATKFYINESSEIVWANNAHLTVIDEMGLWQKHLYMRGSHVWMDYDIAYTDQHDKMDPVPVMGGPAVLWLSDEQVIYSPLGSDSWVLGSTISSYLWTAPGASATSGLDTATPTITYNAAGRYRISLTVTAANGKSFTGYRYVFVHDETHLPATNFELLSCDGDRDTGGWSFSVRLYDEATLSLVRERAMVILSARDWYGSTEGSIDSNIIAMGWISEENIHWDPENNYVDFTVEGPQYWFGKLDGFPTGVEYSKTAPTAWTKLKNLTVDRGLWHLLHWRSTATAMMDIYLTGDTQYLPSAEAGTGSLWSQIVTMAEATILAKPVCDNLGRLKVKVDTQFLGAAARAAIPTIMTLTQDDLREAVDMPLLPPEISQVDASGIYYNGTKGVPLLSRAPGKIRSRYGTVRPLDNLLVPSQTRLNELAGLVYAAENNPYKNVDMELAANNRTADISEPCRLILSIGAADTVRGIVLVNQKFLPRKVSCEYDAEAGYLLVTITCDAETTGSPGVTVPYVKPKQPGVITPPGYDNITIPSLLPIGNIYQPIELPVDDLIEPGDGTCELDAPANGPYRPINGATMSNVTNYRISGYIPCIVRTASHTNRTTYAITARFQKLNGTVWDDTDDDAFYNVYAVAENGSIIATGTHDAVVGTGYMRTGTLDAIAAAEIKYLTLEIDTLLFRPTSDPTSYFYAEGSVTPVILSFEYAPYGPGYRAKVVGTYDFDKSESSWPWFQDAPRLGVRFPGITGPLHVKQVGTAWSTQVAISELNGEQFHDVMAYMYYWTIGEGWVYGPVASMVSGDQYYEMDLLEDGNGIGVRMAIKTKEGLPYCKGTVIMTSEVILYQAETYRILLTGVDLYNVCPVAAAEA